MASRADIFAYIESLLKTVKLGNSVTVRGTEYDFQTDLGLAVKPWRESALGEKENFDLVLSDEPSARVDSDVGEFGLGKFDMPVIMELRWKGKNARTQIEKSITDLTALFNSDYKLGGLVRNSLLEQRDKTSTAYGVGVFGVVLALIVTYVPGPTEA